MIDITVVGAGGEYMESVVVVEWHKNVGDAVRKGDLVVTVETAKAATEIEASADGVLREIRAPVGQEIDVGGVLGVIGDAGEAVAATADEGSVAPASAEAAMVETPAPSVATDRRGRIVASPLARRVASERGIDLSSVHASSPSGRIRLRDLDHIAPQAASAVSTAPPATAGAVPIIDAGLNIVRRGTAGATKIVFLHGFGSDSYSWQPLLAALGDGYEFWLVDLPAHGRSSPPTADVTVHSMARSVLETLSAAGVGEFHLVGHSLGGAVAMALAADGRASVQSLTLLAPAGLGPEMDGDFISGFARASRSESLEPWLRRLFADPSRVTTGLVQATMQARSDGALRDAQVKLAQDVFPDGTQAADLRETLKVLQMPKKLIWGDQDRIVPKRHALGTGGLAALHFLPSVGHMPHAEAPATVARLLLQNIRCGC
ncbi:acetoin dehydrogenase dihydrolipoyllysine-residue acetyltransferase subunit [Rhizobium sp. ACO-34A]|nr:acetoin dehydrogenase dihydrolipoyllysine-residue acetyltransferase subunit [Rhizobium sp. ACO-34A]ATN35992.1 acetoin dehydrogenase dihydrolipoyllysine-residue acetyltransferase subunit [Rhizobium sp. ACO-34A]